MAKIITIAQNLDIYDGDGLHPHARTSSINIKHLISSGANGLILGHSEVGDTPEIINKKILSIINSIKINKNFYFHILIGEKWEEFHSKSPKNVAKTIENKCRIIFKDVLSKYLDNFVIAYEPKWGSFGSGKDDAPPPSIEYIAPAISIIRKFIENKYGKNKKTVYVYGGRADNERAKNIMVDKNISGLLLGSACNSVKKTLDLAHIIDSSSKNKRKILVCNFKAYELADPYNKYIETLKKLPNNFTIFLAPPFTDIRLVADLVKEIKK